MTNQQMIIALKGNLEQKKLLFDQLIEKSINEGLEDNEIPILEALKKELIIKKEVVQLSAVMQGSANLS